MPRIEFSPIKTKKHTYVTVGADIHFSGRAKAIGAAVLFAAGYILLAPHFSDGKSSTQDQQTGTSSTVPEVFQPGTHVLTVNSSQELALGGVGIARNFQGNKPTNSWYVEFQPNFPTFTDGKPVRDPYIKGAKCTLENAGINLSSRRPPEMICTGPRHTVFEHHGEKRRHNKKRKRR